MSASVHPTYAEKSQAMASAAQKAIIKPVKLADAASKPENRTPAKALQGQLQLEFEDEAIASNAHIRGQKIMLMAVIAGATWVLGFALYANL